MRAKEFTKILFESKLSYVGNCTDDDVIEHIFGDATRFAQLVDEHGDDFELDDLVVKYDPESDVHSFYYKQQGVAEARIDEFYDEKANKPEGGKLDRLVRRSLANKIPVFVLFDNKPTKSGYVQAEHPVKGFLVIGSGRKTYTTFNDETQKATKDGNRVYIQPRSMWNASRELDLDEGVAESSDEKDSSDDIVSAFVSHYKDDPVGMFMHAKSSYLDAVSRAKNFSMKAAKLNKSHQGMSKQEFQDSVLKHFGPHLKNHGFPKHASEGWGAAEQDMMKSLTQGVTEGSYREGGSITHDGVEYDFDRVMRIAEKLPTKTCSVDKLSWILKYDTPNKERLERADITVPLIVTKSSNDKLAAIDGLHRLAKAVRDNVKTVKVKYIKPSDLESAKLNKQGVTEDTVDEMALSTYKTMGDFSKPGPFTGADKQLVPHSKNIEKATKFFERTPYDFRLFFSHLKGTGKYSEHGPMTPDEIRKVFGQDAEEIINGSEDAITVVYVGNKGDAKVMLTPWMMAHRFGHAIAAGDRYNKKNWHAWREAEKYFFQTVNSSLEKHYGKVDSGSSYYMGRPKTDQLNYNLTPEYNALFNAIGTQRSSTTGQIRRPYEFLYELFAQYLGTGKITLNPLPTNLTYGRKAWGTPTKYMNIKSEYRDELSRKTESDRLAHTMEYLFYDVLSDSVGKIFVM